MMKRKENPDRSMKNKDIRMLETLKKKKFIDAEMAGYIADKIVEIMPNL